MCKRDAKRCKTPPSTGAIVLVQRIASQLHGNSKSNDHTELMAGGNRLWAVLSLSGQTRTQGAVCKNQLKMIVQANPSFTFDVFHVSDTPSDEDCVAATRAEPNVRTVAAVTVPQSEFQKGCAGSNRLCPQLFKQQFCRDTIFNSSAHKAAVYIHTRFDLEFQSPLILSTMPVENYFYVFLSPQKKGNVFDQIAHPIEWNGEYTLARSVPDYGFVGNWEHVSAALNRVELMRSADAGTTTFSCFSRPTGSCQGSPEELFLEALKREGIWFGDSPPVQLLFASPVTQIIRQ